MSIAKLIHEKSHEFEVDTTHHHHPLQAYKLCLCIFMNMCKSSRILSYKVPHTDPTHLLGTCEAPHLTLRDWPPFLCRDVWAFLLVTRVPYCSLYNHGYTSIGNIHNTRPNEALRIRNANSAIPISSGDEFREGDENGVLEISQKYLPAYNLLDGTLERAGRTKTMRSRSVETKEVVMWRENIKFHAHKTCT